MIETGSKLVTIIIRYIRRVYNKHINKEIFISYRLCEKLLKRIYYVESVEKYKI